MFKNYAIGTTLLALMFSLGTSAQSPKTESGLQARSQLTMTSKSPVTSYAANDLRGGGAPSNDLCTGAVVQNLSVGSTLSFNGDNTGATALATTNFLVVWEAFTTTTCATVVVNYCVPGFVFDNFLINLASQCPDVLTGLVTGAYDDCQVTFTELPAGTWYIPVLVDAVETPVGPYSITVSATACPLGYCSASAGDATFESIGNVSFAGINNPSTAAVGYENFTSIVGTAAQGSSQAITVTIAGGYPEDQVLVWIDFDQSDSFEAGELVYTSAVGAGPHTGTINIPANATLGQTRVRIRLQDSTIGANNTPCGNNNYGQVEDYTLNITSGGGGTTPPNDLCTGAVAQNLAVGSTVTYTGDNTGATLLAGTDFVVVWEAFTTTTCATVTVNYCLPGSVFTDFLINLTNTCPDFMAGILTGTYDDCSVTFAEIPAGTWYIPVLVDPASTPIGDYTISASAVACPAGYCSASAVNGTFENISNVLFAGINNPSTSDAGYEDFTNVVGTAAQGSSQTITVTLFEGVADDQVLVWIDYDQSESFEASELVYTSANGAGPHSATINIPANAALGNTRMRIRMQDIGYSPNNTACGTNAYGQVEDYTINITGSGVVCDADAGTLSGGGIVCFENDAATLVATANGDAVVPAGFVTGYALTEGAGLVIIDAGSTPEFTVDAIGVYTIHTLVYDPTTLDLSTLELGVTTGFDVNGLLIQGGGAICASLDVSGAAFIVEICSSVQDRAGFDMAVFPNPSNGDFAIRSAVNGAVTVELLDLSGRLVYSSEHIAVANEVMQVQLGGRLAAGTYMLRMANADGNSTVRITVK